MPRVKRWLFLIHRWLGIGGCLLFSIWFASGIVMMYVPFPSLTPTERLAGLPPIAWRDVHLTPDAALKLTDLHQFPAAFNLEMMGGQPVYRIIGQADQRISLSAIDGHRIEQVDALQALAVARAFSSSPGIKLEEILQRDQWTVAQNLDALRPLYLFALNDASGTELYVSARNGEVVRDTTRHERFWNWLGAVPHWIYFTPLRTYQPLWRLVVIWVSGVLIIVPVSGLFIGILRLRLRRTYRNGHHTPYRGWQKWHHLAGLIGGVFLLTWIVSGWLSVNPNRWFAERSIGVEERLNYSGHAAPDFVGEWPSVLPKQNGIKEVRFLWQAGQARMLLSDGSGQSHMLDVASGATVITDRARLFDAAQALVPGGKLVDRIVLEQADAYWYSHHENRVLPVLRAVFDDAYHTWVHIDPKSGDVLGTLDDSDRAQRWWFNALHQVDYLWLVQYRPLWDFVIIPLLLAGMLISCSGVVIGFRRLRR